MVLAATWQCARSHNESQVKDAEEGARLRAQEKERGEVPMEEGKAALSLSFTRSFRRSSLCQLQEILRFCMHSCCFPGT